MHRYIDLLPVTGIGGANIVVATAFWCRDAAGCRDAGVVVQALLSLQMIGMLTQPDAGLQTSVVQALLSSQLIAAFTQPVAASQSLWCRHYCHCSDRCVGASACCRIAGIGGAGIIVIAVDRLCCASACCCIADVCRAGIAVIATVAASQQRLTVPAPRLKLAFMPTNGPSTIPVPLMPFPSKSYDIHCQTVQSELDPQPPANILDDTAFASLRSRHRCRCCRPSQRACVRRSRRH